MPANNKEMLRLNMLFWSIPFITLVSLSLSVAKMTGTSVEDNIPKITFAIIIFLYILGLCQVDLFYGIVFIGILLFASFGYNIIYVKKFFSPGLFFYTLLFLVAIFLLHDRNQLLVFDEVYHWAVAAKNMYLIDNLNTSPESNVALRDYPPATAIFQYYFLKSSFSTFSVPLLYVSNVVLASSCLIVPLKRFTFDNLKYTDLITSSWIIFWLPILILPTFFSLYSFLGVDILLGTLAGYLWYLLAQKNIDFGGLILGSIVIVLIKMSAFVFLVPCFCFLGIKLFKQWNMISLRKKFLYFCTIVAPIVTAFSWKLHLALTNANITWNWKFKPLFLIEIWDNPALIERRDIFVSYFMSAFSIHEVIMPQSSASRSHTSFYFAGFELPYVFWFIVLICLFCAIWNYCNKSKTLKHLLLFIAFANFLYFIFVSSLYVFAFSVGEGQSLSSYSRYLNSYLTGMLVLVGLLFIQHFKWNEIKLFCKIPLIIFIIIAPSYKMFAKNILFHNAQTDTNPFIKWNYPLPDDAVIYPYKTDFTNLLYYLTPTHVIPGFYPSSNFDLFLESTKKVTHLFLGIPGHDFKEKYGHYFINSINENSLYKITFNEKDQLLLKYLYTLPSK